MKEIDWAKTLNNIVFTHEQETVTFTVNDIEQLSTHLSVPNRELETKCALLQKQKQEIYNLKARVLQIELRPTALSTFKVYA